MDQNQKSKENLLDTTDCLEAVGVFRAWKNVLFVIMAICLILLQVSFWLVNTGCIGINEKARTDESIVIKVDKGTDAVKLTVADSNIVERKAVADVNEEGHKAVIAKPQESAGCLLGITFDLLSWVITFVNAFLVLAAMLYFLTILFSLKISLIGRLGGISHISRAFFIALVALILLVPWQLVFGFGTAVVGAIYTPCELVKWKTTELTDIFGTVLYYLRFCGYWLLVVLLLILSQLRSARWTRAILRRLEVI